jgi:hypothetical protein
LVMLGGLFTGITVTWVLVVASRLLPMTGGALRRIDVVVGVIVTVGLASMMITVGSGKVDETLAEVTRTGSRLQLAWLMSAAAGALYYGIGRLREPISVPSGELMELPTEVMYQPDVEADALIAAYTRPVGGPLSRLGMSNRSS